MGEVSNEHVQEAKGHSREEVIHILNDLFEDYQPSLEKYQWPRESMRWYDLTFCILEIWSSKEVAHAATKALLELRLLDVEKLARLSNTSESISSSRTQLILGILQEAGFKEKASEQALTTLIEAAKTIQTKCDGKVQQLLRKEGEKIIRNVAAFFGFSALDDQSTRQTITRWLQNVLNLPVYLETESTNAFCAEINTDATEIIAAADELDINIAIVDELILDYYNTEMVAKDIATTRNTEGT